MNLPILNEPELRTSSIVERLANRQERVHINLGPMCNNNCIFCMEEDRDLRYVVNSAMDRDNVTKILHSNAGAEEVCFTSGEPTMVENLPEYVKLAQSLGYHRRSVMTNGRRLSYMSYAVKLLKAGMNFFYVSIHGHTQKLHDSLVRTKGAFEQTLKGLDNLAQLKRFGVTIHTSTVITKRNLPHLSEIYAFLREHGVDQVVFNVMQANGRADTHFETIFPTYTDIATEMEKFISSSKEESPQAFLVDIPLCTTENIPDFNRGFVEEYVHFEVPRDEPEFINRDDVASIARKSEDDDFLEITRNDLDTIERSKRPECSQCKYNASCEGVWKNYTKRYGWDEFVPIAPSASVNA